MFGPNETAAPFGSSPVKETHVRGKLILGLLLWAGLGLVPLQGWNQQAEGHRRVSGAKLRTMTFNIRYDFKNDGPNRWDKRVDLVAQQIEESRAAVVCLQEDKRHQVEDLQGKLKQYGFVGKGRNATGSGERCSILWNKKSMKLKGKGDFWLSDTPDTPGSNTWGDKYPRKVTWALLETKRRKKRLLVLNTHLPEGRKDHLRQKGVELIRDWVQNKLGLGSKKRSKKRINVLIAGDFNTGDDTQPYKTLLEDQRLGLRDCWVDGRGQGAPGTYCGFKGLETRNRIDWLLVGGAVRIYRAAKLDKKIEGRWPSDHYAVIADLELF